MSVVVITGSLGLVGPERVHKTAEGLNRRLSTA